jgi:hypothetical protein
MEKYATDLENMMVFHYHSLGELAKRRDAGLEALKLGFEGKKYSCELFKMSKNTLCRGVHFKITH